MHRFLCPNQDFQKPRISLTNPKEIHHLKNVLRLKPQDKILIFNGQGEEGEGHIESLTPSEVIISLQPQTIKREAESQIKIALACAIPKKAKFEYIIEKCTELGVDEIIPMKTARTEIHATEEIAQRKFHRYQTVGINAAKQSQRKILPVIFPITTFKDALKTLLTPATKAFIPALFGKRELLKSALSNSSSPYKRILFFIGPEGDFTPQEVDLAIEAGCTPLSLGPTTLKVDTAAITVVAFCRQFLLHNEE